MERIPERDCCRFCALPGADSPVVWQGEFNPPHTQESVHAVHRLSDVTETVPDRLT